MRIGPAPGGAAVDVRVVPRAARAGFAGVRDGALVVRLTAPPVDGAANEALVDFLASALRVPRRSVTIQSGGRSRRKRVAVQGLEPSELRARLARLVGLESGPA